MNGRDMSWLEKKMFLRLERLNDCSYVVRVGLKIGIERGVKDSRVRFIVIIGKG